MNIAGLNSGAIMLLALGLAFVVNQISTTQQSAKLARHAHPRETSDEN
jgi:hypothetical protein